MCTYTSPLPPVCLSVYLSAIRCRVGHVYFYSYCGRLNSVRLFRERLPAPLVYVLGNTIWSQVLSIYLKPSVSFPVLTVSRVSSRFHPPSLSDSLSTEEKAFRKERERGSRRGGG